MGETPKTSKRKMTEESPSTYDSVNEIDAPDVTYDYLPKSKVKDNKCNIPLGRRPLKFIRSPPSISHNTSRLSKQIISPTEDPSEEKKKCEQLFLDIFARKDNNTSEISGDVTEEIREDDKNKETDSNDFSETALFDDSSNDVMYQLSQQIEKDIETVSTNNISLRTVKGSNGKKSRSSSYESSENNSIIRDVPHLQKNKHQKKSLVCNETPKRRHNVHHGANKKRTAHQSSNPSHLQESSVTLLLEDGNDAGFVELDETILTGSVGSGSNILSTQKCTAQEIEDKRLQALKKLQEKKFKSRYYGFRHKISFK